MRRARYTPDRTVQGEIDILVRLGFTYLGTNSAGHHLLEHPAHGRLRPMSSTPRNAMTWRTAHRCEVARLMGLSLWQYERLIAGQSITRTRPKRRRPRNAGRGKRRSVALLAAAPPAPPVTPLTFEPNPGSAEAVRHGCQCPVFKNRKGVGLEGRDGIFEVLVGCPVHEPQAQEAA